MRGLNAADLQSKNDPLLFETNLNMLRYYKYEIALYYSDEDEFPLFPKFDGLDKIHYGATLTKFKDR